MKRDARIKMGSPHKEYIEKNIKPLNRGAMSIADTKAPESGAHNPDDALDLVGYGAIIGELGAGV